MSLSDHGREGNSFALPAGLLIFFSSLVILFTEMIEPMLFQYLKVFGHEMGVVAVAMLGLGVAGLASYFLRGDEGKVMAAAALGLGPTVVLSFFVTVLAPNSALAGSSMAWHFFFATVTALTCSLPYFCAGLIMAAAYIRLSAFRVYGLSLTGSGLGITLTYAGLPWLGAEGSMLAAAALAALLAAALGPGLAGAAKRGRWRAYGAVGLAVCALLLVAHLSTGCFDLLKLSPRHPRARELFQPAEFATEALALPGSRVLASKWSAISRIDALETPSLTMEQLANPGGMEHLKKSNPRFAAEVKESFQTTRHLYANNIWFSSLPGKVPLRSWVAPYTLLHHPRVLVIGVGGGIDLARALSLDPEKLVGVEINPAVIELMRGPLAADSGNIYARADIKLMDGRSFVHSTPEKFDLINLVFADLYIPFHNSNVFMESYLYTGEAFDDYLRVLSDHGFLSVTKMVGTLQSPTELLRITATGIAALRRAGIADPQNNIAVIGFSSEHQDAYGGTMLVKKTAFTSPELDEIRSELEPPLFALYLPGSAGLDNPFTRLILSPDPAAFYRSYPLNIEPTSDDHPFFYLFDRSLGLHRNMVFFFLFITAVFFWVPYLLIISRGRRFARPSYTFGALTIAALELGYFFVEGALVQKLNLYLGGPLYSLSTVTAAFLLYPGLSGFLSARLGGRSARAAMFVPALALIAYGPLLNRIVAALPALSAPGRMLTVFALLAPLCLPLGLPFPVILDRVKNRVGERAAGLFYGVSATAGVVMVALSLYFSARFGIRDLYLAGAFAYLVVSLLVQPVLGPAHSGQTNDSPGSGADSGGA